MSQSVAVVIPAHNAEETILRAIESAKRQTRRPDEIVVGCDGCTDGTAEVSRRAGAVVLELPKANGSVARNAAARQTKSETVFFLDADDWWDDKKVEAHLQVWSEDDPGFVIDRSMPILPDGSKSYWMGGLDRDGDATWDEFLSHKSWASGSSISVSRAHFERTGGFNERLGKFQDVDFMVRCAHKCGPARCLSASYTYYSISSAPSVSKGATHIEQNLQTLFEGWPFVSESQRRAFVSHAYLMAAEVTPWPKNVEMFKRAGWPLGRRFFWKSLYQSFARRSA